MDVRQIKTALPGYFTTAEAAEALGYRTASNIANACATGQLVAYKVGKTWLLPVEQVQALADKDTGGRGARGQARG